MEVETEALENITVAVAVLVVMPEMVETVENLV
jgi:hypothetical protein